MKIKSYKYRIYPNEPQQVLLAKHFGSCRFIYNKFLALANEEYKLTKISFSYNSLAKKLPAVKKEYLWLKEVNSQSLQGSLKNLESAYKNFFGKRSGFPIFKSKYKRQAFKVPQNAKIIGNLVFLPKFQDGIKIVEHRKLEGKVIGATVSKTPTNKYFISFQCEVKIKQFPQTNKSVGIDLGIKSLIVTSDGEVFENPKTLRKYERKLAKVQRKKAKMKKGSNRSKNQRLVVARIYEKITNVRKDHLNKVTTKLVQTYDFINMEDLNVKGMMKNRKLSKAIGDASFGTIKTLLAYKCDWHNKELVTVGRFFASSKTCNVCGAKNEITLKDRLFECCGCGTQLDRDHNAAKNILEEGRRLAVGTTATERGASVRHLVTSAVRNEALKV